MADASPAEGGFADFRKRVDTAREAAKGPRQASAGAPAGPRDDDPVRPAGGQYAGPQSAAAAATYQGMSAASVCPEAALLVTSMVMHTRYTYAFVRV